jgi:hypothetical protein
MEYAAAGVREYYILDDRQRETAFYRLNANGIYEPVDAHQGVIRSQVLPGFQFRLADLSTQPEPPALVADPLYSNFVSPFLRAERERAEQERERAEQEYERAEQERKRAKQEYERAEQERKRAMQESERATRYAAMLRAMGIDPDSK